MLRVTVQDSPRNLRIQLEGSLEGPWRQELEECLQRVLSGEPELRLRVDLTGVTNIDSAGKAWLSAMHRRGAEFVTADCMTKSIVEEIARDSQDAAHSKVERIDPY